jgi:putative transcriptional regulator
MSLMPKLKGIYMPIIVNLGKLMILRNISTPLLVKKTGISQSNLLALKSNRAKLIRFSTLSKICMALDCQPGDILEFKAAEKIKSSTK